MKDLFSQQSDYYAKYRPSYPDELYDFIMQHVSQNKTAWDCATGSGQVAARLAEFFDTVYASDISKEQMQHAPQQENIRYVQAPAEETGFDAGLFDLITVAQAIHWFDIEAFYEEVTRTAAGHALLAVIGYGMVRSHNDEIDSLLRELYDYTFGSYFGVARSYLDHRYRTLPFPFEEIPSPSFQTRLHWTLADLQGFLNSWSTIQKFKEEKGVNPADEVIEKIKPLWPKGEEREVVFPVFMRMGRVHG